MVKQDGSVVAALTRETTLATLLLILLHLVNKAQGQQLCSSEFLTEEEVSQQGRECTKDQCTLRNTQLITRLVPSKAFTCAGRIVEWRAAGELQTLDQVNSGNAKVRIWRPTDNRAVAYTRTRLTIELSRCENNQTVRHANAVDHKCELTPLAQVPVQVGDIVALEVPRSRKKRVFTLFFNTTDGPDNYEFFISSNNSVLALSDAVKIDQALPLLSLTVVTDTVNSVATLSNKNYTFADTTESTDTTQPFETTADYIFENGTESDNKTAIEDDVSDSRVIVNIAMTALFVGVGLMPLIIVTLVLALMCSLRKNRKLKRQMKQSQLSLSNGLNSSTQTILSESRADVSPSSIAVGENVAYNKRVKSDDYDYVINELVYTSIGEHDRPQLDIGSPNACYMTILDPATTQPES